MLSLQLAIAVFFLKDMGRKHTAYHINNSDTDHTLWKQQLDKNLKITFASPSKDVVEKKKENNYNYKAFYVKRKRTEDAFDDNFSGHTFQIECYTKTKF